MNLYQSFGINIPDPLEKGGLYCARCFKALGSNPFSDKLVQDRGVFYGRRCYEGIQKRLDRLQTFIREGRIEEVECTFCGRRFKAYPENLTHQGGLVRCCFCCTRNSLKFKGKKCWFEMELNERL